MKDNLMSERYLRLKQIIGDPKSNIQPIIPISKSAWWLGVKSGKYPTPKKLGSKTTVWLASEIYNLLK